jgi:hypothetical protein
VKTLEEENGNPRRRRGGKEEKGLPFSPEEESRRWRDSPE